MLPFLGDPGVRSNSSTPWGRQIPQDGVAAAPVVEHGDVLKQIARGLASSRVAHAVRPPIVEAVEKIPGRGALPAVTLRDIDSRMPYIFRRVWQA